MSTIQELLAQRAELEKKIAEAQRAAKADAIAKVKALMAEYGLSAADLAGKAASRLKAARRSPPSTVIRTVVKPGRGAA
jgi:DNA-binding protein H-NS